VRGWLERNSRCDTSGETYVGIVDRRGQCNGSGRARVDVAQEVRQRLALFESDGLVTLANDVVRRPACCARVSMLQNRWERRSTHFQECQPVRQDKNSRKRAR
jgi:hypothetical protein